MNNAEKLTSNAASSIANSASEGGGENKQEIEMLAEDQDQRFNEAKDQFDRGNFREAIETFEQLQEDYPWDEELEARILEAEVKAERHDALETLAVAQRSLADKQYQKAIEIAERGTETGQLPDQFAAVLSEATNGLERQEFLIKCLQQQIAELQFTEAQQTLEGARQLMPEQDDRLRQLEQELDKQLANRKRQLPNSSPENDQKNGNPDVKKNVVLQTSKNVRPKSEKRTVASKSVTSRKKTSPAKSSNLEPESPTARRTKRSNVTEEALIDRAATNAQELCEDGQYAEAQRLIDQALAKAPSHFLANEIAKQISTLREDHKRRFEEATALVDQGEFEQAIGMFRKLLEDFPWDEEIETKILEAEVESEKQSARALLAKARQQIAHRQYTNAIETAERGLEAGQLPHQFEAVLKQAGDALNRQESQLETTDRQMDASSVEAAKSIELARQLPNESRESVPSEEARVTHAEAHELVSDNVVSGNLEPEQTKTEAADEQVKVSVDREEIQRLLDQAREWLLNDSHYTKAQGLIDRALAQQADHIIAWEMKGRIQALSETHQRRINEARQFVAKRELLPALYILEAVQRDFPWDEHLDTEIAEIRAELENDQVPQEVADHQVVEGPVQAQSDSYEASPSSDHLLEKKPVDYVESKSAPEESEVEVATEQTEAVAPANREIDSEGVRLMSLIVRTKLQFCFEEPKRRRRKVHRWKQSMLNYSAQQHAVRDSDRLSNATLTDVMWFDGKFVLSFSNGLHLHVYGKGSNVEWLLYNKALDDTSSNLEASPLVLRWPSKIHDYAIGCADLVALHAGSEFGGLFSSEIGLWLTLGSNVVLYFSVLERNGTNECVLCVIENG